MNKTLLASITAAVLIGGALTLPVYAQQSPADPLSRITDFTVEKGEIRAVLRQVAAQMGVGIDIAPTVQGTVSLSLRGVTNEVLLKNLTEAMDATYTFQNGKIYVQPVMRIRRISGDAAPGGAAVVVPTQITLKYENSDVREVLRQVFNQAGIAYTLAPDLQGTVNLSVREVSFETALGNILRQVDATYLIEAGVYHVVRKTGQSIAPATPMPLPGMRSTEPPIVIQDDKHLYLISSGKIVKIRKSDLKVEQERSIPVQWGNRYQFGGS